MKLLTDSIVSLGFRKRADRMFTYGDDPCVGWLGLNTASRSGLFGELLVNPVVGVRHHEIEELVSAGRGERPHRYRPPSLSKPLRYLLPSARRHDWVLDGTASDRAVVDDITDALMTEGMLFIQQISDLRVLADHVGRSAPRDQQAAYRWPIALFLSDQPRAARSAVSEVRATLSARSDIAAEELRGFLSWFESRITNEG
jgi:hypothetical protein